MPIIKKTFTEDCYTMIIQVEEEQDGIRLDQFIHEYLATFSRQTIKKKIKENEIIISNRPLPHRPSTKVHSSEKVTLTIRKTIQEDEYWRGNKIKLESKPDVLFEDENLIVISKPPYMATHPTGKHIFNCATVIYESQFNKTIHSIHRIDRETSGILMLGKNTTTAQIMRNYFDNAQVKKVYLFISKIDKETYQNKNSFSANERLSSGEKGLKRVYINHHPSHSSIGKESSTDFKIIFSEKDYVIGLAFPKTGRQHQIRVHAMAHGLPLVGDKLYLGSFKMFQRFKDGIATEEDHDLLEIPRHALHAIGLTSPYNENATYLSHIPNDLKSWIETHLSIPIKNLENDIKMNINEYFKQSE